MTHDDGPPSAGEKAAIDHAMADKGSLCLNWPPSRGAPPPMPRRLFDYPAPVLEGPFDVPQYNDWEPPDHDPAAVAYDRLWNNLQPGDEVPAVESRRLRMAQRYVSASVWAYVRDLLAAGPQTSERLVLGADTTQRGKTTLYLPERCYTCELRYPLSKVARVTIRPFVIRWPDGERDPLEQMNVGWLLWSLAEAYRLIYERHEEFGVWGHAIYDLCFEQLVIKDVRVHVDVGS